MAFGTETDTKQNIFPPIKNYYKNRNVLVTGADGFLGTNAVHYLTACDAHVSILSRRSKPRAQTTKICHLFRGDLRDGELVRTAVKNQDIVFDFAGASGAVASNQEPFRHLEEECSPHLSLFQACSEIRKPPVVAFCSTRLVYGKPSYLPVDEKHPLAPRNMYAVHKITLENYLKVFASTKSLPFVILRLSNPYGPYQPKKTTNYGIINLFMRLAAQGSPITIFGDGRQQRDYVFVDDVVTAFLAAAMTKECYCRTFNFGGRHHISIQEAVQIIAEQAGNTPIKYEPWPDDYQQVETGDYYSNLQRIDRYIALPDHTSLRDGFLKTIQYYRQKE